MGTNELRAMLALALSTSEEPEALLIFIYVSCAAIILNPLKIG